MVVGRNALVVVREGEGETEGGPALTAAGGGGCMVYIWVFPSERNGTERGCLA